MKADAVSRVDAVALPVVIRQMISASMGQASDKETPAAGAGTEGKAPKESLPLLAGREAAELLIPSASSVPGSRPGERYAKIRIDENTKAVMIQIIDAANGEIVREIPPHAWNRVKEGIPLPKGTLFEKEQ